MRIRVLGDYSVTYEVSGRLGDTKNFLGSKGALHRAVLDTLHEGGVEIVSPAFESQRQFPVDREFIPAKISAKPAEQAPAPAPDTLVFDKADRVEKVEDLRQRLSELDKEIAALNANLKEAAEEEKEKVQKTIDGRTEIRDRLAKKIGEMEVQIDD